MHQVLIVDDDPTFCMMLKTFLEQKNFGVKAVFSAGSGSRAFQDFDFDIVLTDYRLPDKDGIELLKEFKSLKPETPVILMTRYADIRMAVNAIKLGAFEYVTKPVNPDEILLTIRNALKKKEETEKQRERISKGFNIRSTDFQFIEGKSAEAQRIMQYASLVAPTDISVIIHGDSGTGKEYIARTIHLKSKRKNKPFVAVDCGALSKELAGSELFGHMKGSFTDAHTDKEGQFQIANGGTLFLDEIGNLSYEIQLKLLRATQEMKIRRIGGTQDIKIDVRIIVASNEDLDKAVKKGTFREDLYHRLNEFKIEMPSLKDRKDDIEIFSMHFLKKANQELEKNIDSIDERVMNKFMIYSWPGNIRELRNVIKRAVLLAQEHTITIDLLPSEILQPAENNDKTSLDTTDLKAISEANERHLITKTLEKAHYNKTKAAQMLNIDRKTLYNKMRLYGIEG
ncbi:MAG: sigma-54-dependent Fis family transcriptional regulator [Bacteroidales bacterium]|jgi:two-component system response regulator HydG|nr:sigma-54-dependent Fis family transcriptional regulator [Bacteroidales bacterium]